MQWCSGCEVLPDNLGNQPHSCDDEHKPSVRSNCQVLCPRTHRYVDWRDHESNPRPYNLWATQFTTKLLKLSVIVLFCFSSDLQDSSSPKSVFCIDDAVIRPSPHRGLTEKSGGGSQAKPAMAIVYDINMVYWFPVSVFRDSDTVEKTKLQTLKCRASLWEWSRSGVSPSEGQGMLDVWR